MPQAHPKLPIVATPDEALLHTPLSVVLQKLLEDKQFLSITAVYAAIPKIRDTNSTCAWTSP